MLKYITRTDLQTNQEWIETTLTGKLLMLMPLLNKGTAFLTGKAKQYALLSASSQFDKIDNGNDDLLNRILWFAAKGNQPYPKKMTIPKKERKDDD